MYSSIKKDSLVTAANVKALTETSETTSNTAIFNTTISQSDSDVNSSIRTKGENNTKFSLPETDRYVKNINDIYGYKTIFYKGIMPSEKGFRFSSGL